MMTKARITERAAISIVTRKLQANGYTVEETSRNFPIYDLIARKNNASAFIDVKGQQSRQSWHGKPKPKHRDLFYIHVVLDAETLAPREQCVLTQDEFNGLIAKHHIDHPPIRNPNNAPNGFYWTGGLEQFAGEGHWHKLPGWRA